MEKEQDINFSHFKGNLTRKPILKGNEKKYAILNVACNRPYTNEKGKTVADFISLKVWKDPEKLVNELDKSEKYLIYCATGARSEALAHYMDRNGFKEIYYLIYAGHSQLAMALKNN